MTTILRHDEIDINNIRYYSQQKFGNTLYIPIGYEFHSKKIPLIFQIPSIKLNDSYKHNNIIVPINCINKYKTQSLKKLLLDIDQKIMLDFKKNAHIWFRDIETNVKNFDYKSCVNEINDKDTDKDNIYANGVFGLNLIDDNAKLIKKQQTHTRVYNVTKNICNECDYHKVIVSGTTIQSIVEVKGIIIKIENDESEVLPYIKVHQVRYIEEEKINDIDLDAYSFLDSEIEPKINYKTTIENVKKIEHISESEESIKSKDNNRFNRAEKLSETSDDVSYTDSDNENTDNIATKFFKKSH